MKISLETKSGDYQFDCHEGETLLVAGLASGLTLPYECASGTCGTCRGRVMGGTVEAGWADAPGYARLHRAKGDVLMCQARPTSDCVLRVPAQVARNAAIDPARMQRKGTLANLSQLTHDVIEFEVALSAPMSFAAGQFVTVHTPDVVGHRSYSMVNYADAVDRLAFVVKRKPGGKFSDWLFERAKPGADLDITGPLGRATFRPEEARGILCIAGGSGIAGMMSILEHARRIDYVAKGHHAHVFFGVRTLQDAFYVEDFNSHVDASGGRLEVTLALSHEDSSATRHPAFPHVRLASGMVHEVAARAMAGRYDNLTAFVAGPAPMVDAALRVLITEGQLPGRFIRYDKFA